MKVASAGRGGEKRLRRLFKKRFKGVSVDEGGGEIHRYPILVSVLVPSYSFLIAYILNIN